MFFKFKYASKLENFLEYVNGFAGYVYYIWWLFVLVTLLAFFVLKIFNAVDSCLKTIAILWLLWIPLSIVFFIHYIVSEKGVLVNENEVKIILNHPTMFSIKLKRIFYVSDIKSITYVDSETNKLYRKIREHNHVFDFFAGTVERAPLWWQEHSLEWMYRLLKEPKRMWRRYIIGNTLFLLNIAKEKKNK